MSSFRRRLPIPLMCLVCGEVCDICEAMLTGCGVGVGDYLWFTCCYSLDLGREGVKFSVAAAMGDW